MYFVSPLADLHVSIQNSHDLAKVVPVEEKGIIQVCLLMRAEEWRASHLQESTKALQGPRVDFEGGR